MSETIELSAKGVNGQLYLMGDKIRISHKGILGFMTQGFKGDKDISIRQISAIQYKKAGIINGYIQFSFLGGAETKRGALDATQDENSIMFNTSHQQEFDKIKAEIEKRMKSLNELGTKTVSESIFDQIKKLAELRDHGILTQEEFDDKKKYLLGKI